MDSASSLRARTIPLSMPTWIGFVKWEVWRVGSQFEIVAEFTFPYGGARRLDRIFDLIKSCRYSFHDLSRVELDVRGLASPRFNLPFELGLAVACDKQRRPARQVRAGSKEPEGTQVANVELPVEAEVRAVNRHLGGRAAQLNSPTAQTSSIL